MSVIVKKKKFVSKKDKARQQITEAVSAFQTAAETLNVASATLASEARSNRDLAASLLDEAEALENESTQGSAVANKLASFTL